MDIELKLTVAEVNALLQVLGELPTKTGAWTLMLKIQSQAEAQKKSDGN
jgi:hypothetical protein